MPVPPGVILPETRRKTVAFLVLTVLVLCAHLLLNAHFKAQSESISYGFFLPLSLLTGVVCWSRAVRSAPGMRRGWALMTSAISLWFLATVMAAWAHIFQHALPSVATIDDFLYFFYGVPTLLAIAAPDDRQPFSLFFWFDGIQAAAVGFLAYIAIFAAIPFSGVALHPIPVSRLIWIYDAENLLLAVFATARMMVSPRGTEHRRFFQVLTAFLWTYGICATIYNHIVASAFDAGLLDILVDIPFIVLGLIAFFVGRLPAEEDHGRHRTPVALFIDNARPILLGLALIMLSAVVAHSHFRIAMGSILGAFVIYGVRSAILQSRLISTQMLLETANNSLSEMTLEDGLTGIANRRCFDQRLAHEWSRSHRTRSPLSLVLIDIDRFKLLNDTYGHLVGDECLKQVARTLRSALNRPGDLLARYGGEEFVALLPDTPELGARNVAARMQAILSATTPIPAIDRQVTVSIGTTTWEGQKDCSAGHLVDTADRALYAAKQNGRNRTEFLPLEARRNAMPAQS
jgi:diguanylate cyclase (GGDEF)-like protein